MNENADIEAIMWVSAGTDSDVCHLLLAPAPALSCCTSCSTWSKENQRNIDKSESKVIQSSPFPIHMDAVYQEPEGDKRNSELEHLRSNSKLNIRSDAFNA